MAKAVVIVDMLKDFVQENGALPVKEAEDIVDKIRMIRHQARKEGILVVYANDAHAEDDPEFAVWPKHAVKETYGSEVIDELMPEALDIVIEKQELSMFAKTTAHETLRQHGIDELYFTGVCTEYCVKLGAIEAAVLDYKTYVVIDAIAGVDITKGDQFKALVEMGNYGVRPKYTKEVLEELVK